MAIVPKPVGTVAPPNDPTAETAGTVAIPNDPTAQPAGTVAIPNNPTAEAAKSPNGPNNIPAQPAGSVAIPNELTPEPAKTPNGPNIIPAEPAQPVPRTLTPLLNADFCSDSYAQGFATRTFEDIFTFSRASTKTFINRRQNQLRQWEYFLDTAAIDERAIEYDPVTGACLGVSVEGEGTNNFTYSEDFENAAWSKTNVTLTPGQAAPDDTNNATRLQNTGAGDAFCRRTFLTTISTDYTTSFWVKSGGTGNDTFRLQNLGIRNVDLTATNEWQRFEYSEGTASGANQNFGISSDSSNNPVDIIIFASQLDDLPFASSYKKTTDSPATTAADIMTFPYDGNIGDVAEDKTLYLLADVLGITGASKALLDTAGTIDMRYRISGGGSGAFRHGGTSPETAVLVANTQYDFTGVYAGPTQLDNYLDGEPAGTNQAGLALTSGPGTDVRLGALTSGADPFYGHIARLRTYNVAMTDEEVARL